ncbi:MAG: hemerythrin family protein [Pseudomonadota bacterium]|nr:hemerythrin family protein [Pseudomonadota bacterium]
MATPDCSTIPQVALDFMNTVHCEELTLVQSISSLLDADTPDNTHISQLLEQWIAHTEQHFSRENHYMEEYRFPAFPVHAQEHEAALQQIREVQQQWDQQQNLESLKQYVQHDWPDWFKNHISTMDFITAQFLSQFDFEVEL